MPKKTARKGNDGYLTWPAIRGDTIAFVTEDDLWTVPRRGGVARRLTTGRAAATHPVLSPDGRWLAYTGREEHHPEVFVMPAGGGEARRITWLGAQTTPVAFTPGGDVVFASDAGHPFIRQPFLYTVAPEGGPHTPLDLGPAQAIAFGPRGAKVIARNVHMDPAWWKRYRGGTHGDLWIDPDGKGRFRRLLDFSGNFHAPMWIGSRIYFLSDHEGIGNLYSVKPDGTDPRRHTDHATYYARRPQTDGRRIVYQHAGEIWVFDPRAGRTAQVPVDLMSPRTQRARKFVESWRYLEDFDVHPAGHSVAVTARGRPFTLPLWEGAVEQHGVRDGARHRLARWLDDGSALVLVSDEGGEEALEIHGTAPGGKPKRFDDLDVGRATGLLPAPKGRQVAITNHRHELLLADLSRGRVKTVDRSRVEAIAGVAWSADGRWLAYGFAGTLQTRQIRLYEVATGKVHEVTRPEFRDFAPAFDPEGRYLYFLSLRSFDPVYDQLFFDLGFPRAVKVCVVPLREDVPHPFMPPPRSLTETPPVPPGAAPGNAPARTKKKKASGSAAKRKAAPQAGPGAPPPEVKIDLDGLADRVLTFPVPDGRYGRIAGLKGKVLFTDYPVRGTLGQTPFAGDAPGGTLEVFDLKEQKHEILLHGVSTFRVSRNGETLVYRSGRRLRAVRPGVKPEAGSERGAPGRKSGWLDLNRIRISVDPGAEWRQMFREAWRLQRDQFWTEDMSGVDWRRVHDRYRPLVEKVATRIEFSDLVWEMHGELGTSHAYEMGGDHRVPPRWTMGHLGADLSFDRKRKLWRVDRIVRSDAWKRGEASPLAAPGVNVRAKDTLLAVNGQPVDRNVSPMALLVNQGGQQVALTVGDAKGEKPRTVVVQTLRDEMPARYRAWVTENRRRVHEATGGRAGYLHVPDMGPSGYAEFHRGLAAELHRDGLVVDVRYNRGGHVSPLLIEKLARRRLGYDVQRWGATMPYPHDTVAGPIVCLTNEHAGSDGDIFSHVFKLMKLGPLVGKRTWGGVIGIWVRHTLVDGGITTQPEFSFWFEDVGWGVENYGTDPDHDVDVTPQDWKAGRDPQMEKALSLMDAALADFSPVLPKTEPKDRPNLALPRRLPRRR